MMIPAALSIATSTLGIMVALFSIRAAKAPNWQEMRAFSLVAFTAGAYSFSEIFNSIGASDTLATWAARIGLAFASMHGPGWILFLAQQERRPTRWWERSVLALGLVIGILCIIPGLVVSDDVLLRSVPWLGATYTDTPPSSFGKVIYALNGVMLLLPLAVVVHRALRGATSAIAYVVGLSSLAICACNDGLVGAGVWSFPYVLPIGFTVAVVFIGTAILERFVDEAKQLDILSHELEAKVATRTEELAQAQEALFHAEKLASLGRLAAGAAHEINNPCSVLNTNLAYLHHSLIVDGEVPDDADRCLEESIGAADRVAKIIRQLVDAGRVGSASSTHIRNFSVRKTVDQAMAQAQIGLSKLVHLEAHGDPSIRARGDSLLLHQIIMNLVTNAGHAVEFKGHSGRVLVTVEKADHQVFIDVMDEGTGIDLENIPRLFEPFFTTKRPGHGMGLGLAVSLGLARAQGGDLRVVSTGPAGTRMRLVLEGVDEAQSEPMAGESVEATTGLS
jgi:signal transduction histidine kinase